jgi:hypothetical protein
MLVDSLSRIGEAHVGQRIVMEAEGGERAAGALLVIRESCGTSEIVAGRAPGEGREGRPLPRAGNW